MDQIAIDVGKLILNFLASNRALKDKYLDHFANKIEEAKPKYGKFKDIEMSLKFKLHPAIKYHEIFFEEKVDIVEDTNIYNLMLNLNPSIHKYKEILVANIPFDIHSFDGIGYTYINCIYEIYSHKTLLYQQQMKGLHNEFSSDEGLFSYMFEGKDVDLYYFSYNIEISGIDRFEIVFCIK